MHEILPYINFIKIMVLATLIHGVAFLRWRNKVHQLVMVMLFISTANETATTLLNFNHLGKFVPLATSISVMLFVICWLLLSSTLYASLKHIFVATVIFLAFGIGNLLIFEGPKAMNYNTFIFGSFIYILALVVESYIQLRNENFSFFTSNNYILLFSPISLFVGLSFIFAFKSNTITLVMPFDDITLWDFVISYTNIIYYALLNIYIYREQKSL